MYFKKNVYKFIKLKVNTMLEMMYECKYINIYIIINEFSN